MGRKPLALQPQNNFSTDGFLCLSDIEYSKEKLFGAMVTYKQGVDEQEEVQIYRDIDYLIKDDIISFSEKEKICLLADKIEVLIARKRTIDIILRKKW